MFKPWWRFEVAELNKTADHFAAALEMQRLFGEEAGVRSALRADAALEEGDTDGFAFWQRVESVLRPRTSETRN